MFLAKLKDKKNNKKLYAIKVLDKYKIESLNILKYAKTEKNVLKLMNHPFIVKLNFAFQSKGKLFMAMDFCPGFFNHLI